MSKNKKELASLINTVQGKIQEIFFDLDEFSDYDSGGLAQQTIIKLMEEITSIRKNILQRNNEVKQQLTPSGE